MTTVSSPPAPTEPTPQSPPDSVSLARSPRLIWTRNRGLLIGFLVLLIAALAIALAQSGAQHGRLDPRSADPQGSRALAELLKGRGVSTRVVTTLAEARAATGPDTTLLVAVPDAVAPGGRSALRQSSADSGGRTVLVAPLASAEALVPGTTVHPASGASDLAPSCALPAAVRAGSLSRGGLTYSTTAPGAERCYPASDGATLLRLPAGSAHRPDDGTTEGPAGTDGTNTDAGTADADSATGDTLVLGSTAPLANAHLDEAGNASLALQLLGSRPHLVWYLPSYDDSGAPADHEHSFFDLIPSGWLWGTLQLAVAALLTALWRARRLGALVSERLPVAVRASEAVEGRARLYRKANARAHTAGTLRAATRDRLALLLALPPAEAQSPESLLPALSDRLGPAAVDTLLPLLFGPAPTTDLALVTLADRLDALEREVRTS